MKEQTKPINKRISTYRKLAGYTQQTAADALGIKKNTYARMELHGNPTPEMLAKLANLYTVSVNMLIFGSDGGETTDLRTASGTTRLTEPGPQFKKHAEITLTLNELNCVKACRELSKEQRDEVMALINKLYNDKK
ncbi:MAG: helix-turn-helix domain-containing protein [Clostridia bacterium]|nr:helix-turn-helix domain-containing protein [Clostridia bacterium]